MTKKYTVKTVENKKLDYNRVIVVSPRGFTISSKLCVTAKAFKIELENAQKLAGKYNG